VIFYFLSSRLFENDFRVPLIDALNSKGHQAWHARIGRRNILTPPNREKFEFNGLLGFPRLVRQIRAAVYRQTATVVFVDTTGAFLPIRSLILRAVLRGLWCFDIFDNLLYDFRGFRRLKQRLGLALLVRLSPIKIALSRELLRLFPAAHHLDNAADLQRKEDTLPYNHTALVMLFAIDGRFDFTLVEDVATAAPQMKLYLYGRPANNDPAIKAKLDRLCKTWPNVIYRGQYRFNDVAKILAPFSVGFTPYTTDSSLTEFINPDKYYYYLSFGMEVISSDIPQARCMSNYIHIARSATEVVTLVERIANDVAFRKNTTLKPSFGWHQRADEFIEIIAAATAQPLL
jgi:hypothetical protein